MVEEDTVQRSGKFLSFAPIANDRSSCCCVWLLFSTPMFVIVAAALFYSEPDLLAAIFFGFVVSVVEFPFFVAVVYVARRLLAKVPTHGIIVATILAAIAMNTPLAIVAQLGRIG